MPVDIEKLAEQFTGAKFAALILIHAELLEKNIAPLLGLENELPANIGAYAENMIDTILAQSPADHQEIYGGDCGIQFREILEFARDFYRNKGIELNDEEAFTLFKMIVITFAIGCQAQPERKLQMQKAAGMGFIRRIFSLIPGLRARTPTPEADFLGGNTVGADRLSPLPFPPLPLVCSAANTNLS